MKDHWILEKTARGIGEVETRALGLSRQQRALLIMTDGRTPVEALCRTAAGLGDGRHILASLVALGLLQPAKADRDGASHESAPKSARHDSTARPTAPRPARRRSLALARLYLMNIMEQALRHDDHPVRQRLLTATSRSELLDAFAYCREIAEELGVAHAATIEMRFMELLPDDAARQVGGESF